MIRLSKGSHGLVYCILPPTDKIVACLTEDENGNDIDADSCYKVDILYGLKGLE